MPDGTANNQPAKPNNPFAPRPNQGAQQSGGAQPNQFVPRSNQGAQQNGSADSNITHNPFVNQVPKAKTQEQPGLQSQVQPKVQPKEQQQEQRQEQPKVQAQIQHKSQPQEQAKPKTQGQVQPQAQPQVQPQAQPKVVPINPFASSDVPEKPKAPNPFANVPKAAESAKVSELKTEPKQEGQKFEKPKYGDKIIEAEVVEKKSADKNVFAEVKKSIPGEESNLDAGQDVEEIGDFKSQVVDILDQAGITAGTLIKTVIVVALGILIVLGYVYGWYGMIVNIFDKQGGGQEQPRIEEQVVEDDEKDEEDVKTDFGVEEEESQPSNLPSPAVTYSADSPFGLVSSYIFGLEFNKPAAQIKAVPMGTWGNDAGIKAAQSFGLVLSEVQVKFIEYVALLRKLENIYNTDVYELLNQSSDRRAALQQHMNDLVVLINDANTAYGDVNSQLQIFEQQYAPFVQAKDLYESNFFNALYAYYGEAAYVNLGMFVKAYQDMISIKAYFNAYKSLGTLFAAYIDILTPRYNDISVNTEALIKGIHVFDIPKSDIKAIIQLGE